MLVDLTIIVSLSSPALSPTPAYSTPPLTKRQEDWTQRQESSQLLTLAHTLSPGVPTLLVVLGIPLYISTSIRMGRGFRNHGMCLPTLVLVALWLTKEAGLWCSTLP